MAGPGPDKDVHISLEDQQKINKFARHNQRLEDIKVKKGLNILKYGFGIFSFGELFNL